jgi:hypothetical protein
MGSGRLNVREITSGFCVFRLFLVKMSGKGDDVCVDLLVADRAALSVRRHVCGYVEMFGVVKARGEVP